MSVISGLGCQGPRTAVTGTINAVPAPTVAAGGPTAFCPGGSVTLTAANGGPNATYQFLLNGQPIGAPGATHVATQAGIYAVQATAGPCSGLSAATVSVTITPLPSAAFTYATSTFCLSGGNPTPIVTGASGGTFSSSAAGLNVNPASGVINLAGSTVGTYTVTYSVAQPCPAATTQTVTLTTAPAATFTYPTGGPLCAGATTTLAPTLGPGASAGTFSSTPAGLALNATTGAVDLSTSGAGTYTVTNTIAASGSCGAATATTTMTLNPGATATLTPGGPTTFCAGGSVTLTAASTGTNQFLLNGQPIGGAAGPTLVVQQSGTYTVVNTTAGGCSATSGAVTVTVNPVPSAAFAFSTTAFCLGGPNPTPTITGAAGGTFSGQAGLTIDPLTGTIDLASSSAGPYTVIYTITGACAAVSTQNLTLTAPAVAAFTYPAAALCAGSTQTVAPTFATGATAGTFTSTPSGLGLDGTTGMVSVSTSAAGTYTVTNTVAGGAGCAAATGSVTLTINAVPSAAFTYAASTICLNATNPAPTITGAAGGAFSSAPAGLTIDASTGVVNLAASTAGTYTVSYAVAGPCPATVTQTITLTAPALAGFTYPTAALCAGSTQTVTATLAPGAAAGTFSSTPAGLALNTTTGAVDISTSAAGIYTVTNTVASGAGCAATTATATLTVNATPAQPTVTPQPQASGIVVLTSSAPTGNQWYLNGTAIPGATGSTHTVSTSAQSGTYTVISTNVSGCASAPSAGQLVTVTGTSAALPARIVQLFPNPTADGWVMVALTVPATADCRVLVLDAAGREVAAYVLAQGTTSKELDLRNLPTGVYAVRLVLPEATVVRRLVRE